MKSNILLKKYFNEYLKLDPLYSIIVRNKGDKNIYTDYYSNEYIDKYTNILKKYKNLSRNSNALYDKYLFTICNNNLELIKLKKYLIPLNSYDNILINFKYNNELYYTINNDKDFYFLINRIKSLDKIVSSIIQRLNEGIRYKITISRFACGLIIKKLKVYIKNKDICIIKVPSKYNNKFYHDIINKHYIDNIKSVINFLESKYIKHCYKGIGICNMKNNKGKLLYKKLIISEISLNKSPENIFNIGLSEVKRIRELISGIMRQKSKYKRLTDFFKHMNDKNFIYKNDKELYKDFENKRSFINNVIMKENFYKNVENYNIKFVDRKMENMSPAAYYYAMPKEKNAYIYINRSLTKYKYETFALSIHEGIPGHHYQYRYFSKYKFPDYKIYSNNDSGFSEGWALYSENIGNKYYNDDEYYGKLSYELLRSIRLVVDVGINYYNWSYKKAYNYMKKYSTLDNDNIKNEIERYINMPCQAITYKIGEMEILRLRDKYVNKKGMDIKEFHKRLFSKGIITLNLLENTIYPRG